MSKVVVCGNATVDETYYLSLEIEKADGKCFIEVPVTDKDSKEMIVQRLLAQLKIEKTLVEAGASILSAGRGAGGPGCVAAGVLAHFGVDTSFVGQVGNDSWGQYICNVLKAEGINVKNLFFSDSEKTPVAHLLVPKDGSRHLFRDYPASCRPGGMPCIESSLNFGDIAPSVVLHDGKYLNASLQLLVEYSGSTHIIDAGRAGDENQLKLCKGMDYIVCSKEFALDVAQKVAAFNDIRPIDIDFDNMSHPISNFDFNKITSLFRLVQEEYQTAQIVITIGRNGCVFQNDQEEIEIMPAYLAAEPVVDTNGAGDIFHGAFAAAISWEFDLKDALLFANITASLSTFKKGSRGDSLPTLREVLDLMESDFAKTILNGNQADLDDIVKLNQ